MNNNKENIFKSSLLYLPVVVFWLACFYPLLTFKRTFLSGDYLQQVYPWLKWYSQNLAENKLPFWTDRLQNGFAMFAEGQTAMLYALNILLFKFLSFDVAYNYMFIVHHTLSVACMYLYLKEEKLSISACALGLMAYAFGTLYAGSFYGIFSLRVLCYFPLTLFLVKRHLNTFRPWCMPALCMVLSQILLAGYPQMAIYTLFFLIVFFALEIRQRTLSSTTLIRAVFPFVIAIMVAFWIAFPQLMATWELASQSTRTLQDKKFILWGSVPPWSWLTLFYFSWSSFFRANMYLGSISFFCLMCCQNWKARSNEIVLITLAFFLSLGAFNPLYWILIHLPGASLLRNPGKFIYFALFFIIPIACHSFDHFLVSHRDKQKQYIHRWGAILCGTFLFSILVWISVRLGKQIIYQFGEWYLQTFVLGKSYHRYSTDIYYITLNNLFDQIFQSISLLKIDFWLPFLFGAYGFGLIVLYYRKRISRFVFSLAMIIGLSLDLYGMLILNYGVGFVGNLRPYEVIPAFELKERQGRWLDLSTHGERILGANQALLYGASAASIYSPLANREYFELLGPWGVVDDGFGYVDLDKKKLYDANGLVDFLGIKYVLMRDEPLTDWTLEEKMSDYTVYENKETGSQWSLVQQIHPISEKNKRLEYLWSKAFAPDIEAITENPDHINTFQTPFYSDAILSIRQKDVYNSAIEINPSRTPAFLVRNILYDSSWKARIDGIDQPLIRVNHAFQGLYIPPGSQEVTWSYEPAYFQYLRLCLPTGFIFLGIWLSLSVYRTRRTSW